MHGVDDAVHLLRVNRYRVHALEKGLLVSNRLGVGGKVRIVLRKAQGVAQFVLGHGNEIVEIVWTRIRVEAPVSPLRTIGEAQDAHRRDEMRGAAPIFVETVAADT